MSTKAYAAQSAETPLAPFSIKRREPGPNDVEIAIEFCGVCHSDLHTARGEWGRTRFPSVPGHEIVGRVTRIGSDVMKVEVGQRVGVGCMVDSCLACSECAADCEQFCLHGATPTYNGAHHGGGENTYGGYSEKIVVRDHFVLKIPEGLDPAAAAPLLCAGVTTFGPLRRLNLKPGDRLGVVGLGGLGHMAVKLAHAMGAHVVMFTTSPSKEADAKRLGASEVAISTDEAQMAKYARSLHAIIDTVAASHDLDQYLNLLRRDGTMVLLGAPPTPHPSPRIMSLMFPRRTLAGSAIGGIAETQGVLDFCAERGVAPDIEIIAIADINEAYDRLEKGDVRYRFVIDMASLSAGTGA